MILYINRETDEIVGDVLITPRLGEERSLGEMARSLEIVEQPDPPVQAFLVTDDLVIAKYLEAIETWAFVKPVYDETGAKLVDLKLIWDLGEEWS